MEKISIAPGVGYVTRHVRSMVMPFTTGIPSVQDRRARNEQEGARTAIDVGKG